ATSSPAAIRGDERGSSFARWAARSVDGARKRGQDARMSTAGRFILCAGVQAAVAAAAIALAPGFSGVMRGAAPSPTVQLPSPPGPFPIGPTTWRLVDRPRSEPFGAAGEFRNVEVHAWYPAATTATGSPAPYLRDGLAEVRTFATVFRVPETTFDG